MAKIQSQSQTQPQLRPALAERYAEIEAELEADLNADRNDSEMSPIERRFALADFTAYWNKMAREDHGEYAGEYDAA